MEEEINKHFCVQPFVNVTTRITGQNNVCCNVDNQDSKITEQSPVDFFNSQYVKQFREDMLDGVKRADCSGCQYQESHRQHSHRQRYNEYYHIKNGQTNDYYKQIVNKLRLDAIDKPLYVEMHVSNLCNLKCLTCNEIDSSQYHAENKMLGVSKHPMKNFTNFVVNTAKALKDVIHPDLLFLDVRGGETLMVPEIRKVLDEIDPNTASNITLKIQTNGTIVPDETWTKVFRKFKNTKVNVSIDAFGERNTYIRYPSDWQAILNTIEYLKKQDIKFIVNTVVSNLNILYLDELLEWVQNERYINYVYTLDSPIHFRPSNLPTQCLQSAAEKLNKIGRDFVNLDVAASVDNLVDLCNNNDMSDKDKNILWKKFSQEIQTRDRVRQKKIGDFLPEINSLLIK